MRLTGLTQEELAALGNPIVLREQVMQELQSCAMQFAMDRRLDYSDDEVHSLLEARAAAMPAGPAREAVIATYALILDVIDAGESIQRSDGEMAYWFKAFRPA
jgi:hypothetical protein